MSRFLWTQKQDTGPSGRFGHAMAYDADRAIVVLFGGCSSESQNDTWEWDGEYWTQMADIGPSARFLHALVYDGERKRTVLFGGKRNGSPVGDTWQWNGEDWTQVNDEGPAARSEHSMAFDTERKRIVLFGGQSDNQQLHGDTWEWDGQSWTQQQDVGPSPRRGHTMAYDSKRKRTVLFGGQSQAAPMGDTWEWNGSIWTQMADFGPDASIGAAMAYDGENVLIYGGISSLAAEPAPEVFGNTWEWDGKHWTQRQDIGPGPRWRHAVAFDSKIGCLVLFGGIASFAPPDQRATDARRDTWESSESGSKDTADTVTLGSFTFAPPGPVGFDTPVTAILTLTGPSPAGGTVVTLVPDAPLPGIPTSMTIQPRATVGQFTFNAPFMGLGGQFKIKATAGGVTITAVIFIAVT